MEDNPDFPYDLRMFAREAKVRGLYLTVSCDFERMLSDIAGKCAIEQNDRTARNEFRLALPFEMGAKLDRCIKLLQEYNINYYNEFLPQFEVIEDLTKYRTMLAHSFSTYDPNRKDMSQITFEWIETTKDKPKIRASNTETIHFQTFVMKMVHYRDHILKFTELIIKLAQERGEH